MNQLPILRCNTIPYTVHQREREREWVLQFSSTVDTTHSFKQISSDIDVSQWNEGGMKKTITI